MDYYIINGELYSQDELAHHGIKGMKWGIRRTAEQLGHIIKRRKAKKAAAKAEAEKKKAAAKKAEEEAAAKKKAEVEASRPKKVSEMSKEEIDAAIARMNLEKSYINAMKEYQELTATPVKKSTGRKIVDKVVNEYGGKAIDDLGPQLAKSVYAYAINSVLKSAGFSDDYKVHTNNKKK